MLSSSELNPEHLISRPGGVIQVNDMEEIEPLPVEDVTASAYKEEAEIKQNIDRTMGVYIMLEEKQQIDVKLQQQHLSCQCCE